MTEPFKLMYEILALKTQIEQDALRIVSWFYAWYYETGRVSIQFLQSRLPNYQLDLDDCVPAHIKRVQKLRTYFQHNLNPNQPHDRETWDTCEQWFEQKCCTATPIEEEHWQQCLIGFLEEALFCTKMLHKCLICIKDDSEYREIILQDWKISISRYHPPHEFDKLIAIVANDIGRPTIEPTLVRKRFYEKWSQSLKVLQGNYDFDTEARKLIEYSLLNDDMMTLPISGSDIMAEFNLPGGPHIGRLLNQAMNFYKNEPCSRDDLLKMLSAWWAEQNQL